MKLKILAILAILANSVFAQNYHDTQGNLEISSSGQTVFTIPIANVPSINNVGPVINLNYSSGAASGIAGQGWNINSISTISRMATRYDIDGYKDGVDFDQDDKLALDGQRLLLKAGTYWADGSVYETEVQSNTKVELKGSASGIYFIVTQPDGSRSWYGNFNNVNAMDLTSWYITRFEDTDGNFITYNYFSDNNAIYINDIKYSANQYTNITPLNKIVFSYKTISRKESSYLKGLEVIKTKILDKIEVFTNDLLFKKYQLTHNEIIRGKDSDFYQRVSQVQEFNSAGEPSNPIIFTYNNNQPLTVQENQKVYTDNYNLTKQPKLTGDFDGDSKLDFISENQIFTKLFGQSNNVINLPFTINDDKLFKVINTLQNNKLKQAQSILKIEENLGSIDFKTYALDNGSISLINSKNIAINNQITLCEDNCNPPFEDIYGNVIPDPNSKCTDFVPIKKTNIKYFEGDFNGDSVSEMLVINFNQIKKWDLIDSSVGISDNIYNPDSENIIDLEHNYPPLCKPSVEIVDVQEVRLIDLNPNNPSLPNTIGNFSIIDPEIQFLKSAELHIMDFNADGKSDVLAITGDKNYKVFTFKENPVSQVIHFELIGEGLLDSYNSAKPLLFGDYNGDGKIDLMMPDATGVGCETCTSWHIYYSNPKVNGGSFFEKKTFSIVEYFTHQNISNTNDNFRQFFPLDVNKDGKTDLVRFKWSYYKPCSTCYMDRDTDWVVDIYINNIGKNNKFDHVYTSPSDHSSEDNSAPIPLPSNYRFKSNDNEMLVIRYHPNASFTRMIHYLDFKKDFNVDNQLWKVSQSNNTINNEITYSTLDDSDMSFYSSSNSLNYPLVEVNKMPNYYLVKQLKNTTINLVKYRDFKYNGFSVDLNGIGTIDFIKKANTSWYTISENKKTWSYIENNPLLRGAILKKVIYQPNSLNFDINNLPSSKLSEATYFYQQINTTGTFPYVILKQNEINIDYTNNVVSKEEILEYSNNYYLPQKVKKSNYLINSSTIQNSSLIVTNYDNNPTGVGSNYNIGRPNEITTTKKLFVNTIPNTPVDNSNTQIATEKLFYSNNNLIKSEKSSNNSTEKLVEEFAYFSNGLVQSKTVSATGTTSINAVAPVVMEYTYDPTNRFIKTTKNVNDNLTATNVTFHPVYGLVTSSTNALGQTSTSEYDNWGKRTKVTDFLGKSIMYTYTRSGEIYATNEIGDDGTASVIEQDILAREIRKGTIDLNGNWNYVKTEYDAFGRKYRVSEPFAANASPTQWNTTEFDELSRPIKTIAHTGKIVNTNYNGLTVSATEPTMSKSKTMNALGLVISATDTPGGTILYKYDANGNLLESDYEGIKTIIQYDKWGRKEKLEDTSAGIYTYNYDAFSRTKEETTPKGKTVYTYDIGGRIATKVLTGLTAADATNMTATYSYHPTYKWLTNLNVVNPIDGNSSYEYSYDSATKQLNQTIEKLFTTASSTSPVATFTKSITFDAFGRVNIETSTALSYGKTSTKTITHVYKNGTEWQLKDGATIIWQANTVNSRGQLTNSQLGNGITNAITYDVYGYLTQQKQNLGVTNIVTLSNQFEPILGNLTSRYNSLFDVRENFEYDALDRLIKWDGTPINVLNLPFNTTTDGFTFTSTTVNGSVSNYLGTLKVVLKRPSEFEFPIAAQKTLSTATVPGDQFRIQANISNKTVTGGALVKAIIVEEDPSDSYNFVEYEIGTLENGLFDTNYTVSDFIPNPIIKTRFIVVGTGATNGGGLALPSAIFYVDNLKIDKIPTFNQEYDNKGRITQNRIGDYKYEIPNKPYQNSKVRFSTDGQSYYTTIASNDLNINYNMFSSPYKITHATKDVIDLSYNITEQRSIMYWGSINLDKNLRPFRRYYSADGSMEVTVKFTNNNYVTPNSVEIITFVDGTVYDSEIVVKNTYIGSSTSATGGLFYLHRDNQGSIVAITNSVGAVIEKRQYDPWGLLTKIQDGAGSNLSKLTFFDRGYTGHEHLESVGLINMNARVYDPILHRFLQPDKFIQDPYNTQNYNRYGYCINNPLKYTDVSGNVFGVDDAIYIAAAVAVVSYLATQFFTDQPITIKGIVTNAVIGAISGAVTFGIGSFATTTFGNIYVRAAFQAFAHGTIQGSLTAIQGGKFWNGFSSGAISSIASSAWQGDVGHKGISGAMGLKSGTDVVLGGTLFFGTISGGAGAALTGGNFWQGAVTGLIVSGLNHVAHDALDGGGDPPIDYKKHFSDIKLLGKLYANYQVGENKPFYYNASDIDLANSTQRSLGLTGIAYKGKTINLFKNGRTGQALAFGKIDLIRVNATQFRIATNKFDFEYRSEASFSRNFATFVGGAIFGNFFETKIYFPHLYFCQPNKFIGGSFDVIFKGTITIPK
ncbi:MAG: hypothetical protein RI980_883 [Bacteroidota bacterium]|jgi:RHS repeat-associated protein